jgi:hypothetical protein
MMSGRAIRLPEAANPQRRGSLVFVPFGGFCAHRGYRPTACTAAQFAEIRVANLLIVEDYLL